MRLATPPRFYNQPGVCFQLKTADGIALVRSGVDEVWAAWYEYAVGEHVWSAAVLFSVNELNDARDIEAMLRSRVHETLDKRYAELIAIARQFAPYVESFVGSQGKSDVEKKKHE